MSSYYHIQYKGTGKENFSRFSKVEAPEGLTEDEFIEGAIKNNIIKEEDISEIEYIEEISKEEYDNFCSRYDRNRWGR